MLTREESAERRHMEVMTGLFMIAARLERVACALRKYESPDGSEITENEISRVMEDFATLRDHLQQVWQVSR